MNALTESDVRLPNASDGLLRRGFGGFVRGLVELFKVDRSARGPEKFVVGTADVNLYPRDLVGLSGKRELIHDPIVRLVVYSGNLASIEVKFPSHYVSPSVAGSDADTSDADKSTVGDATDVRSPLGASVAPSGGDAA